MIQGILDFFTNVYDAISGIFSNITQFFKTLLVIPTLGTWATALIPDIFVAALALGLAFVVVKIVKDLL